MVASNILSKRDYDAMWAAAAEYGECVAILKKHDAALRKLLEETQLRLKELESSKNEKMQVIDGPFTIRTKPSRKAPRKKK